MSVSQLLESMDSNELSEWYVFYRIEEEERKVTLSGVKNLKGRTQSEQIGIGIAMLEGSLKNASKSTGKRGKGNF